MLLDPRSITSIKGEISHPNLDNLSPSQSAIITGYSTDPAHKPYEFQQGIAVIRVQGALIHNLGWSSSDYTGYDVIRGKVRHAMNDKDVKGVLIIFHTPGGTVFGCADTGDLIAECGKVKPVWTLADEMAYSAGQWLHSQGTRRLVTQSAGLGSIGVVVVHADMSKMLDSWGISMTLVHDGKHKVDGNPFEKLSESVKAQLTADCKKTRGEFATVVARGTGLSIGDVLKTEAQTYSGQDAVDVGLADEVVSSNNVLDDFIVYVNEEATATGTEMSENSPEATNQNATAERTRIAGILNCEEAKDKSQLANHLALNTSLNIDDAKAVLKASSAEAKEPQSDGGFEKAMNQEEHPNLSSDSEVEDDPEVNSDEAKAKAMAASYKEAAGVK